MNTEMVHRGWLAHIFGLAADRDPFSSRRRASQIEGRPTELCFYLADGASVVFRWTVEHRTPTLSIGSTQGEMVFIMTLSNSVSDNARHLGQTRRPSPTDSIYLVGSVLLHSVFFIPDQDHVHIHVPVLNSTEQRGTDQTLAYKSTTISKASPLPGFSEMARSMDSRSNLIGYLPCPLTSFHSTSVLDRTAWVP